MGGVMAIDSDGDWEGFTDCTSGSCGEGTVEFFLLFDDRMDVARTGEPFCAWSRCDKCGRMSPWIALRGSDGSVWVKPDRQLPPR